MRYVALIRGINVGGNRPVSMDRLKSTFEGLGYRGVSTYINSGNVVFTAPANRRTMAEEIEAAMVADLGVQTNVLVLDRRRFGAIVAALPASWDNGPENKCDVLFLWKDIDEPNLIDRLPINPAVEEVRYVKGAVLWRTDRARAQKSRRTRLVGGPLYQKMTVRNAATVRRLHELLEATPTRSGVTRPGRPGPGATRSG